MDVSRFFRWLGSLWTGLSRWQRQLANPRHSLAERGELLASDFLRSLGYQIVARRTKIGGVEIDLVAKQGNDLVLVEVKTRRRGLPTKELSQIMWTKRKRFEQAARCLARQSHKELCEVRVDAVVVVLNELGRPQIQHFPDFFGKAGER